MPNRSRHSIRISDELWDELEKKAEEDNNYGNKRAPIIRRAIRLHLNNHLINEVLDDALDNALEDRFDDIDISDSSAVDQILPEIRTLRDSVDAIPNRVANEQDLEALEAPINTDYYKSARSSLESMLPRVSDWQTDSGGVEPPPLDPALNPDSGPLTSAQQARNWSTISAWTNYSDWTEQAVTALLNDLLGDPDESVAYMDIHHPGQPNQKLRRHYVIDDSAAAAQLPKAVPHPDAPGIDPNSGDTNDDDDLHL